MSATTCGGASPTGERSTRESLVGRRHDALLAVVTVAGADKLVLGVHNKAHMVSKTYESRYLAIELSTWAAASAS